MTTGRVDGVSERGPWPDGLCRGRHAEAAALEYEQFQEAIEAGGSAGSVGGACLTAEQRVKLAALLLGDPGGTAGSPGDAE